MKIHRLLISFAVCVCLSLSVFAHPGRTDSSGGHTNHSTGEYHYHHGYPAHQHYDKDGDGKKDCPYNFSDKTSTSNSRTNSNAEYKKPTYSSVTTSPPHKVPPTTEAPENEKTEVSPVGLFATSLGLATLVFSLIAWWNTPDQRWKKRK